MPELTALLKSAGSYSHFWPQKIPHSKIRHIFISVFLYNKDLPWWIVSLWSVLKKLIFEGNAVHAKCWFAKEKPLFLFLSDNSFTQSMKHYLYYGEHLSPDTSCFSCSCVFWQKKPIQLNPRGKPDYTKPGFLLLLEELFAHLNVEHSKYLPTLAGKHYRA